MRTVHKRSWWALLAGGALLLAAGLLAGPGFSLRAQGFATNTPAPTADSAPLLATNTPQPEEVAPPTPDAPPANYALRLWLERGLIDLALEQLGTLTGGGDDARRALQITLYELERRFPGAPRDPAQRERLLTAMLEAPRGTVDMRAIVRPFIEAELNRQPGERALEVRGFAVETTPARLNPDEVTDALVNIRYPAGAERYADLLYDDYVLALRGSGDAPAYTFVPFGFDLPAAPFGEVERITLYRLSDVNRDGVDEAVLRVVDDSVNDRLVPVALRAGLATDLTRPGEQIRFGRIQDWPLDQESTEPPVLRVLHYRAEAEPPDWPCISQIPVNWSYVSNFYRPATDLNSRYQNQDSLACRLLEAEPLFSLPPAEAIQLVEGALLDYSFEAPGADRALMTLAMLYTLDGQIDTAVATAQSVMPAGGGDSWTARQARALIEALGVSSNTALDVCEALVLAAEAPACDMQAVLGRFLRLVELTTESDLVTQLEQLGFPVAEAITVSQVGRADRTVIQFDLAQSGWWAFLAQRDGTYAIEQAQAPAGFEPEEPAPTGVAVPQAAYDALLLDDSPQGVINILDTLQRGAGTPESPEAAYLRTLSEDLLGRREAARDGYYALWATHPDTIWGQLASQHLERR